MYNNKSNKLNLKQLEENGNYVLPVGTGFLASGLEGEGRMLEPEEILDLIESEISNTLPLNNKKVFLISSTLPIRAQFKVLIP